MTVGKSGRGMRPDVSLGAGRRYEGEREIPRYARNDEKER